MSQSKICRLCVEISQESKSLYDENGAGNELYEIARKYFHPSIVDFNEAKHLKGICLQCWRHVCDFHTFQCSVASAQLQLLESKYDVSANQNNGIEHKEELVTVPKTEPIDQESIEPAVMIKEEDYTVKLSPELAVEEEDIRLFVTPSFHELNSENVGPEEEEPLTKRPRVTRQSLNNDSSGVHNTNTTSPTRAIKRSKPRDTKKPLVTEESPKGYKTPPVKKKSPKANISPDPVQLTDYSQTAAAALSGNKEKMPVIRCVSDMSLKLRYEDSDRLPNDTANDTSVCNDKKSFKNLDDLLAKWLPNIKCGACPKTFSRLPLVEEHFRKKHPSKKFYIVCCNRKLTRKVLKQHLLTHEDPNVFKCDLCDKVFPFQSNLLHHKHNIHSELLKSECKICGKSFVTQQTLRYHYNFEHNTDIHKLHPNENNIEDKPGRKSKANAAGERSKYECTMCSRTFSSRRSLRQHQACHTGNGLYLCAFCPMKFKTYQNISEHRKLMHHSVKHKPFYTILNIMDEVKNV